MKKLNVNRTVKVFLTQEGLEFLRKEHELFWQSVYGEYPDTEGKAFYLAKRIAEYKDPEPDEKGLYSFQLWNLMEKFGKEFNLGNTPYFLDIYIDNKDLE